MPIPRAPWFVPALATAVVLAGGLALAAVADQRGDTDPAPSRPAADSATASREVLIASPGTGAPGASSPADALAGECSVYGEVPAPAGAPVPAGATLWRGVFATFARPGERRAARAAVAEVAGAAPGAVSCSELAVAAADAPVAAERSAAAPDAVSRPNAVGSGSCFADHEPARPGGLPKGAVLRVSASGEYRDRGDETAVRAAVATIAGVAPERVECSYYVPPIGSCQAELAPAPGGPQVPDGATATGFVSGDYTAREQVDGLRAALAAMAGLAPSDITCEDYPDMPMPIEPGPGGIEPAPLPAGAAEVAPVR